MGGRPKISPRSRLSFPLFHLQLGQQHLGFREKKLGRGSPGPLENWGVDHPGSFGTQELGYPSF